MLSSMNRILDLWLDRATVAAWWVVVSGGYLLFLTAILVAVDVLLRKFFLITLGGASDLASYAFAVSISWAASYILICRGHIRVDVVYQTLPLPIRSILDVLSALSLTAFGALLTRWCAATTMQSYKFGSTANSAHQLPLWIPQSLWTAGFLFFTLVGALLTLRCFLALVARDHQEVARRFGTMSQTEEAAAESSTIVSTGAS